MSVTVASPTELDFAFSAPVTWDGVTPPGGWPQVEMPVFGWQGAVATAQVAANVLRFAFVDDQLAGGIPWDFMAVPAGLDLHGATMPVPQSGTVQ